MKIVFSRKGFDAALGGCPSPILDPEGTLLSFPIPYEAERVCFTDVDCDDVNLGEAVEQLSNFRIRATARTHLDPDLRADSLPRRAGWRPLFGQAGRAQAHLRKHGVGPGDVFLFYGWFRRAGWEGDRLQYTRDAPDLHVIFGWLQVEAVLPAAYGCPPGIPWAAYHPHFHVPHAEDSTDSVVYVSRRYLKLPGTKVRDIPGAGAFPRYADDLCLTAVRKRSGLSRSVWHLPKWFWTPRRADRLSFHEDPDRWERKRDHVLLRSVSRGQEFVLDADLYREAAPWLRWLISTGLR
jgi:hypothetical protein